MGHIREKIRPGDAGIAEHFWVCGVVFRWTGAIVRVARINYG